MRVARVFSVRFAVCSDARNRRGRTGFMRVACVFSVRFAYVVTRGLARSDWIYARRARV